MGQSRAAVLLAYVETDACAMEILNFLRLHCREDKTPTKPPFRTKAATLFPVSGLYICCLCSSPRRRAACLRRPVAGAVSWMICPGASSRTRAVRM